MFVAFGADAFADRTRRVLAGVGDAPQPGRARTGDDLTDQERQIARRAADGLSNAEIGAELFLSPRTRRVAPAEGLHQARCPQPPVGVASQGAGQEIG